VSFDKTYPNRKDKRRGYRKSARFDRSCRNHGSCPHCQANRKHANRKREAKADAED
jgi:hypothetical protein